MSNQYQDLRDLMSKHNLRPQDVADVLRDLDVTRSQVYRWLTPSIGRQIPKAKLELMKERVSCYRK